MFCEVLTPDGVGWEECSTETTQPSYECGATMEECNQAYQDAMSVTCAPTAEPTMATSLYVSTDSGMDSSDTTTPASNWMFNQVNNNADVQAALGLNDGNTLGVVTKNEVQEYVVVDSNGRVYPTCVQHGASGTACDADLVCWNNLNAGSASEQRSAVIEAGKRNDYKISTCPTLTAQGLSGYYLDQLTSRGISQETFDNIVVDEYGAVLYVMQDSYKHICVGFGTENRPCPLNGDLTQFYFCAGANDGLGTMGWPAQFANAVQRAHEAGLTDGVLDGNSFTHPQCRY